MPGAVHIAVDEAIAEKNRRFRRDIVSPLIPTEAPSNTSLFWLRLVLSNPLLPDQPRPLLRLSVDKPHNSTSTDLQAQPLRRLAVRTRHSALEPHWTVGRSDPICDFCDLMDRVESFREGGSIDPRVGFRCCDSASVLS
jgi:hypothetical protein